MTREEMAALSKAITELTDTYTGRWEDPSQRPDGARPVRMFGMVFPDQGSDPDQEHGDDGDAEETR